MSKRRLATLFLVAALGLGMYLLFRGAPVARTLTFDLGPRHADVVRLDASISTEAELVRRISWSFRPGDAPRRISRDLVLPAEMLSVETLAETVDGETAVERRAIDGRERGDLVLYVEVP